MDFIVTLSYLCIIRLCSYLHLLSHLLSCWFPPSSQSPSFCFGVIYITLSHQSVVKQDPFIQLIPYCHFNFLISLNGNFISARCNIKLTLTVSHKRILGKSFPLSILLGQIKMSNECTFSWPVPLRSNSQIFGFGDLGSLCEFQAASSLSSNWCSVDL